MGRHLVAALHLSSFDQPVPYTPNALAGVRVVSDQNSLLEALERKFEVRPLGLQRHLPGTRLERRGSVHHRQALVQGCAEPRFIAARVRDPLAPNKVRRRRVRPIQHQLNGLAQHACKTDLEKDVRECSGWRTVGEDRDAEAASADQVYDLMKVVAGPSNIASRDMPEVGSIERGFRLVGHVAVSDRWIAVQLQH